MDTKKLLKINMILLILIIFTIVGLVLFNNYLRVTYDPFNDPREYERLGGTKLTDEEMPNGILENADSVINEYQQLLEVKGINNIKIAKIVNLLNTDGKYNTKYVVVDTEANEIKATLLFRYLKNGTLQSLTAQYKYLSDNDFLAYNESLINIKTFNISDSDKESIKTKVKSNPTSTWKIGNKYSYDYNKQVQMEGVYGGIDEARTFTIVL